MDAIEASEGRFVPRTTDDGTAEAFERRADSLLVRRGAAAQEIPTDQGLGAIALCGLGGEVLGYGTVAFEEIGWLAGRIDGRPADAPRPLARLAAVGLALVLPLDAMPEGVRDAFLADRVDPGLVSAARLTDEAIAEVRDGHEHEHEHDHDHGHDHGDDCETCAVRSVADQVDALVAREGHAVVVIPDHERQLSYTVGLAEGGWPELAMSGIPSRAIEIVNAVVEAIRARDLRPQAGMVVADAMSVPLRLREVGDPRIGPIARDRARRIGAAPPRFLQITWPDADGYHPGDPCYDDVNLPQSLL